MPAAKARQHAGHAHMQRDLAHKDVGPADGHLCAQSSDPLVLRPRVRYHFRQHLPTAALARLPAPLHEALSVATLSVYVCFPVLLLAVGVAALWSRAALAAFVLASASVLLPARVRWLPALGSWPMALWHDYFRTSISFDEPLDPRRDYVIAQFPHGAYPIGQVLAGSLLAQLEPGTPTYCLAASSTFAVPGWKHFNAWVGAQPATRQVFWRLMRMPLPVQPALRVRWLPAEQPAGSSDGGGGGGTPRGGVDGGGARRFPDSIRAYRGGGGEGDGDRADAFMRDAMALSAAAAAKAAASGASSSDVAAVSDCDVSLDDGGSSSMDEGAGGHTPTAARALQRGGGGGGGSVGRASSAGSAAGSASGKQHSGARAATRSGSHRSLIAAAAAAGAAAEHGARAAAAQHPAPAAPAADAAAGDAAADAVAFTAAAAAAPYVPGALGERVARSVAIIVGGIAEMFLLHPRREQIKLRGRRGFARLAVAAGAPIVPQYFFGQSAVLSFGPKWLQRLSRKCRVSLGVPYGRWGLPVPRRVDIYIATGVPVPVGPPLAPGSPGFDERVEQVHAAVVRETVRVYYANRERYGWGDRELVVT